MIVLVNSKQSNCGFCERPQTINVKRKLFIHGNKIKVKAFKN